MVQAEVEKPRITPRGIVTYAGPLGLGLFDCEYTPTKIGRVTLDAKGLKIKVEHYQIELKRTGTLPLIRTTTENHLYGPFAVDLIGAAVKSVGFVRGKAVVDISSEITEVNKGHPVTLFYLARLFFEFTAESTLAPGPTTLPGTLVGWIGGAGFTGSVVTALGFAKTFEGGYKIPIDEVVWVDKRGPV